MERRTSTVVEAVGRRRTAVLVLAGHCPATAWLVLDRVDATILGPPDVGAFAHRF